MFHFYHTLSPSMILLRLLEFMFCLQMELIAIVDMVVKLYYEDIPKKVIDLLQR